MNTHPTEFIPGYVLGALDEHEQQAVARHLARCPQCRQEAESFSNSVLAGPCGALPPRSLKHRLLRRAHTSALLRRMWPLALAGVLLVAAVGVSVGQRYYAIAQSQALASAMLGGQPAQRHPLPAPSGMQATLYTQSGQRQALLQVAGMPPLDAGQVYQIWFAQGDTPVASATFTVDASGAAMVLCHAPAPIAESYTQLMVTLEPAGASAAPSGQPVFSASLVAGVGLLPPLGWLVSPNRVKIQN